MAQKEQKKFVFRMEAAKMNSQTHPYKKRAGSQLRFEGRHGLVNAQRFADGESKIRAESRKEPSCPTV